MSAGRQRRERVNVPSLFGRIALWRCLKGFVNMVNKRSGKKLTSNAGRVVHHGRVVDQDIDPTPSLNDGLDNAVAALLVSNVLRKKDALSACNKSANGSQRGRTALTILQNQTLCFLGVNLLLREIHHGNIGTLHGEHHRSSTTDS